MNFCLVHFRRDVVDWTKLSHKFFRFARSETGTQSAGGCLQLSSGRAFVQEGPSCFGCPQNHDRAIDPSSRDHSEYNQISIFSKSISTFHQYILLPSSFEPSSGAQWKRCKRRVSTKRCGHHLNHRVV